MPSGPSKEARNGRRDKRSIGHVARTLVAGGIAGSVAKTTVAPLDRVKILFQASNPDYRKYTGRWMGLFQAMEDIRRKDGIRGLFQGHSATLLRIFPYAAIKFLAYDQAHHYLMPTPADETNSLRFFAGALSGTTSVFFTYPLEVIRVRLAFQTHSAVRPTLSGIIRTIYTEGYSQPPPRPSASRPPSEPIPLHPQSAPRQFSGRSIIFSKLPILKFYRGFTATLMGMVPYAGTSFLIWGNLRARFIPIKQDPSNPSAKPPPRPVADLMIGAISGAVSQTVSYPFEVIRRRMQVGGLIRPDQWMGFRETARSVYRQGGWRGFYAGLTIGYLKVTPMTAVSFATWEAMKRIFDI